jgi:hypothetical protein
LRVATLDNPPAYSTVGTESVAVSAALHISRTHKPGYDRFYGTVSPAEPGALIGYERLKARKGFVNIGGGALAAGGSGNSSFSKVLKIHSGVYRVFVQTNGGAQVSNVSQTVSVR